MLLVLLVWELVKSSSATGAGTQHRLSQATERTAELGWAEMAIRLSDSKFINAPATTRERKFGRQTDLDSNFIRVQCTKRAIKRIHP